MKTLTLLLLLLQQTAAPQVSVQLPELGPAIRQSTTTSAADNPVMREGVALYDQGKFDEALTRFEPILKANPNNTGAMLELSQTYFQKHQYQSAIDLAAKGTNYISPELPQFYSVIGNIMDSLGQPQKAIEIYKKGVELNTPNAGILYLNMGVSYNGLRDFASAKLAFKTGALTDANYPGLHFQLANLYLAQGLMTPLFLASARFLLLEPNSARTQRAYGNWRATLDSKSMPVVPPGNPIYDYIHSPQITGEGNLTDLDAALAASKAAAAGNGKSDIEVLVDQTENLFGKYAAMEPSKEDKETFIWKYYIPFFVEMKQKGFVEPFVYYINQGPNLPGVRVWLTAHPDRVSTFLLWSRSYRWPDKNSVDPAH
jgi:Tfp pilus assembly protein PilF